MFEGLKNRLDGYLRTLVPQRSVTNFNPLASANFTAASLDVDAVHSALRQAESGDVRELFTIYRDVILSDSHVQSEFTKRKLAIIGDTVSILPADKKAKPDEAAANFIDLMVENTPGWLFAQAHLLDSVLWPVAVVEKVFRPEANGYALAQLVPVPHDLLEFVSGKLRIQETDGNGYPTNISHDPDPRRYIIHRGHLLTSPDNWGGPMRSILFWWLLGAMSRDWWARFLDRYGSPFMVGKYNQGDDASRTLMEQAFSLAVKIGGLVVSKETDVEIKQAAAAGTGEAYSQFFTISRREISKLIVGQTLSAEAQSTGMGSGVADAHGEVRDDYRKFDCKVLNETYRDQLFRQILRYNGMVAGVPKLSWGSVSVEESKATGEVLTSLHNSGLRVADSGLDALSEKMGIPIERIETASPAIPILPGRQPLPLMVPLSAELKNRLERADEAIDLIAQAGAADLSRAFRGALSPVRQMVLDSKSPEDLQRRILTSYTDWPAGRVAEIIESALIAYAANGCAR